MPQTPAAPDRSPWLRPMRLSSVVLAGLVTSFALWYPLDNHERAHVRRITRHAARGVSADLAAEMHSLVLAQALLARWWAAQDPVSWPDWELSASLLQELHPPYVVVQWADPDYRVIRAAGRKGRPDDDNLAPTPDELRAAMEAARGDDARRPVLSVAFRLRDGRLAAGVIVPVYREDVLAGFLIGVFDIAVALDRMLADHMDLGYSVSVQEGNEVVYRTEGTTRDYEDEWAESAELPLPGIFWRLRVWPKPDLLAELRSPLPKLAAALGGLLGSMLMLALYLARAAQRRSQELSRARDEVERRVEERTLTLRLMNDDLLMQIAERERAEDSLRNLSGRLLRLRDEEQRRIARELHDSTGQMLGAIAINLDKAQRLVQSRGEAELLAVIRESAELLVHVTQETRTLSFLLHPSMVDELGLEYALPWYVEGFSKRSGIAVELRIQPDVGRLPQEVELTLFRIAQEALTNVHRHSGSRTAGLAVFRGSASVMLEITDQGQGIPRDVLEGMKGTITQLGVGIAGMRERVRQLGGRLEIDSSPGGTAIRAVLPLPAAATTGDAGAETTVNITPPDARRPP